MLFAGASAGQQDVLFEANDALLEGAGEPAQELREDAAREAAKGLDGNYLYESLEGQLGLVDVLPNGTVAADASFGAPIATTRLTCRISAT